MSRYTGPRNKLSRREATDLNLKTAGTAAHASLLKRIKIMPGQHGQKMRRKMSDYGRQLREKQKVKQMYGIIEKQFHNYYKQASNVEGVTGELLLQKLELRLDNVVYRMGFATTRSAARQLVNHGHVLVNEKKVNIPSYQVLVDDVIRLRPQALKIPQVVKILENQSGHYPAWVAVKANAGKIVRLPKREDIVDEINEHLIVEFYSR